MHAPYVLACRGPYLSRIGSDQRDESIYGIRRRGPTFLSTYFIPSMQASVHAPYVLVGTGPYLSHIYGSDRSRYLWNSDNMLDLYENIIQTRHMHACYVLACMGPYLSQIGINQRDESIYGIRRSCQTSLST